MKLSTHHPKLIKKFGDKKDSKPSLIQNQNFLSSARNSARRVEMQDFAAKFRNQANVVTKEAQDFEAIIKKAEQQMQTANKVAMLRDVIALKQQH